MAASSVAGPISTDAISSRSPETAPPPAPPATSDDSQPDSPVVIKDDVDQKHPVLSSPRKPPDFLPPQILQTLRQQQLQRKPSLSTSPGRSPPRKDIACGLPAVRPPANLWSYPRQRSKFTHLTSHPSCICGAGTRDISFLYDVPDNRKGSEKKEIPPTLIPEEFHIHKKVGVVGLEYHQDQYTTQSLSHDHHVTVFPSMTPGSRYEVLVLKDTLDLMLNKAGLPGEVTDLQGPTQIHNLLELVRQEQMIYSVCFHEIIRQVSVGCAERGELLQEIRSRYTQLLDRIPQQVMSLHEDVVSQRALCRRITAEYKQFRSKISSLTDRLATLRDMDREELDETLLAQRDLSSALTESEKNMNILKEYHQLYELQRQRLQESVESLRRERDQWEGAAYCLAQQVTDKDNSLVQRSLRRLQLGEKIWTQLARHFIALLNKADIEQLGEIDECVRRWREGVMSEGEKLEEVEQTMSHQLSRVEEDMRRWNEEFSNLINAPDGRVVPLNQQRIEQFWEGVKKWLKILNSESNKFSGESQLSRTEGLQTLNSLVKRWCEVGLDLFSRHMEMDRYDHTPDHTHSPEHQTMLSLGHEVEETMRHCTARASGDNGVAVGFIRLITPLETWEMRLDQCVNKKNKLSDSEWTKLRTLLREWLEQLERIKSYIGSVTDTDGQTLNCVPVNEVSVAVEKWRNSLFHAITNRHSKIITMLTELHCNLVLWMVQLLLQSSHITWTLTETRSRQETENEVENTERKTEDNEEEEEEKTEIGIETGGWNEAMGLTPLLSVDLKEEYKNLSSSLTKFTTAVKRSVNTVVEREGERRRRNGDPNPYTDKELLEKLGKEEKQWIEQAQFLMTNVLEEHDIYDSVQEGSGSEVGVEDDQVYVLGRDINIHSKSLMELVNKVSRPEIPLPSELSLLTESDMPEGSGYLPEDTERLARQLHQTQTKLEEQQKLTEREQERAEEAEKERDSAQSQVKALEIELKQIRLELVELREERAAAAAKAASNRTRPGGGGGGGGRRGRGGRPNSRK